MMSATLEPRPLAIDDELDVLMPLWCQGERQVVARSILSRSIPEAARIVLGFRREFACSKGDLAGAVETDRLLKALDAEQARLAASLAD